MDLRDIQNLIKFVAKSGASEVKLEMEDVKITIKTNPDESGKEQVFVQQLPVAQQLPQLPLQQQVPVQQLMKLNNFDDVASSNLKVGQQIRVN